MASIELLRDRAFMLAKSRFFFNQRNILEVDCPAISSSSAVDVHIDIITTQNIVEIGYLHSSPEYGMKRLLAKGMGDIYQLSHVFRAGEQSSKHNPEFTLAEWYRLKLNFKEMIEETADFIRLFLGNLPLEMLTYREAFQRYAKIDYTTATPLELIECLKSRKITPYANIVEEGKDALLNLILGTLIEPELGRENLCVLAYYPASQAALAKLCKEDGESVAERFEFYHQGIELANGYHELTNVIEQRERFLLANAQRHKLNKNILPLDEQFLEALEKGIPECCGVAVGFDRLMMLRHKKDISDVIPFDWSHA